MKQNSLLSTTKEQQQPQEEAFGGSQKIEGGVKNVVRVNERTKQNCTEKTKNRKEELRINLFAGAMGGALGAIATQPMDVLRTRMQASSKVTSVRDGQKERFLTKTVSSLRYTYQYEGLKGLYRGMLPVLTAIIPSRSIYFTTYTESKNFLNTQRFFPLHHHLVHIFSASAAVITASTLLNPLFLLKIRMQLQEHAIKQGTQTEPYYKSYWDCTKKIHRDEGIRGFYKGLTASWLGVFETATYFVIYEEAKYVYAKKKYNTLLESCDSSDSDDDGKSMPSLEEYRKICFSPLEILTISGSCKAFASIMTYPHEVLKTRMRELDKNRKTKYKSLWDCISQIYRQEGHRGLYSGLSVHLLRVVPTTMIMFCTYEFIIKLYENHKLNRSSVTTSTKI